MQVLERIDLGDLFEIEVNGHTIRCKVHAKVVLDECYEMDEFENEESSKIADDIRFGALTPVILMVHAQALGMEGLDTLGSVLIKDLEDATTQLTENEMTQCALDDLKKVIEEQIETLKPYMKAA